jgi:hypothetical protein
MGFKGVGCGLGFPVANSFDHGNETVSSLKSRESLE